MTKPKRYEVSTVKPYDIGEFWSNRLNIQNMLITEVNFPKYYHEGDYINSVYTDRVPHERMAAACEKISLNENMDSWFKVPADELLAFASTLFDREITGMRLTRWTNVSSGFELWRIDVFKKSDDTPEIKAYGPNYEPSKRKYDKRTGEFYFDIF